VRGRADVGVLLERDDVGRLQGVGRLDEHHGIDREGRFHGTGLDDHRGEHEDEAKRSDSSDNHEGDQLKPVLTEKLLH